MNGTAHVGRTGAYALVLIALLAQPGWAAEESQAPKADELKSTAWWTSLAEHYGAKAGGGSATESDFYYSLAYIQMHAGNLTGASDTATKVTEPQKSVYVHTALAERYAEADEDDASGRELKQALDVATSSENAKKNNFIYSHLIKAYVKLGMDEEAQSYADSLPAWVQRDSGLSTLAAELARRGEVEKALKIAREDVSPRSRTESMAGVAVACAISDRPKDAEALIPEISASRSRDRVYVAIVGSLAKSGDLELAGDMLQKIDSPEQRGKAESNYLTAWAESQSPEAIAEQIDGVTSREGKLALFRSLVKQRTAAQQVQEAEETIEAMVALIKESPQPAMVSAFGKFGDSTEIATTWAQLLPLARILAQRNEPQAARRIVAQVAGPVLALPPEAALVQGFLLGQVIATQAEIGDLKSAQANVKKLDAGMGRSVAASGLAAALAKAGDVPAALEVIALVSDSPTGKAYQFDALLRALIGTGDIATAKQVLAGVGDSGRDVRSYLEAGRAMTESERGDELYRWLPEMPSDLARAYACAGAAQGLLPQPASPESPESN